MIPRRARFRLIYLAGAPLPDTPRQGALGGLTPYIMNQQLRAAM